MSENLSGIFVFLFAHLEFSSTYFVSVLFSSAALTLHLCFSGGQLVNKFQPVFDGMCKCLLVYV